MPILVAVVYRLSWPVYADPRVVGLCRSLTAFGLVKGVMNFVAGRLSERVGRKRVLLLGWLAALPVPVMVSQSRTWLKQTQVESHLNTLG